MNPNVNFQSWMMIMYPCRYIHCNKCTPLMVMLIMGRPSICGSREYTSKFCNDPKTALNKMKSF